jgi:hypothetical protein
MCLPGLHSAPVTSLSGVLHSHYYCSTWQLQATEPPMSGFLLCSAICVCYILAILTLHPVTPPHPPTPSHFHSCPPQVLETRESDRSIADAAMRADILLKSQAWERTERELYTKVEM